MPPEHDVGMKKKESGPSENNSDGPLNFYRTENGAFISVKGETVRYFFAADKLPVISSQFTTFHQASM